MQARLVWLQFKARSLSCLELYSSVSSLIPSRQRPWLEYEVCRRIDEGKGK